MSDRASTSSPLRTAAESLAQQAQCLLGEEVGHGVRAAVGHPCRPVLAGEPVVRLGGVALSAWHRMSMPAHAVTPAG